MIRACPSCRRRNRVPADHLLDTGRCGACGADLPPPAAPIEVGPADFDEIVQAAPGPVLVDFWAGWCAPCRAAAPEVERAAAQTAGRAVVLKVDTEAHPGLAERFGVTGIPNFVVLRDGRVVRQQAGLVPHARLVQWLQDAGA